MDWDQISSQIRAWEDDPEAFRDEGEGIEPASQEAIDVTWTLLAFARLRENPPLRVVVNGEGGTVMEWRDEKRFLAFEIDRSGEVEVRAFDDAKMVFRGPLESFGSIPRLL